MLKRLCLVVSLVLLCAIGASAQTDKHSVSLSCTQSTSPNITGNNFYRGTVSGGPYVKLNATLVTSGCAYTDTTGAGGTTYFYVATAVDSSGSESAFSNESSATFLGAPAAPTAFKATSN
jgi:fibronectin type 3 domain-containing protein